MGIVRASKYRHVFGTGVKRDQWYDDLLVSIDGNDGNLCRTNGRLLSIHWEVSGGGAFLVWPVACPGRIHSGPALCCQGHTATVLDTGFAPYDDLLIASADEEGSICVWLVDEELLTACTTSGDASQLHELPLAKHQRKIKAHNRRIVSIAWHPHAKGLLATGSHDGTIKLWDVFSTDDEPLKTMQSLGNIITDLCWSPNGKLIASASKDKNICIFDPRSKLDTPINIISNAHHSGSKGIRLAWMNSDELIVSTGFSQGCEREISVWNALATESSSEKLVATVTVDSASGFLIPHCDIQTGIIFVGGKGDGNIRYYELDDGKLYLLSEYRSSGSQRSLAFYPEHVLQSQDSEIARCLKVNAPTVSGSLNCSLETINFTVPRREGNASILSQSPRPVATCNASEFLSSPSDVSLNVKNKSSSPNNPDRSNADSNIQIKSEDQKMDSQFNSEDLISKASLAKKSFVTLKSESKSMDSNGNVEDETKIQTIIDELRLENEKLRRELAEKNSLIAQIQTKILNYDSPSQ